MEKLMSVLKRPVMTEKATVLREKGQFVIEVDARASKSQIRDALEKRYNVDVLHIRTIHVPGKYRRKMGPTGGFQSDRKKAVVQLKEGQQLTWEEVV